MPPDRPACMPTRKSENWDSLWGLDERQHCDTLVRTKGCVLRRLYSTFAGGWPGTGLLLLRLVVGSVLVVPAGLLLWVDPPLETTIISAILMGSGILLILGLWTPVVGSLVTLVQAWKLLTLAGDRSLCLLLGTVSAALAMLGPGLWSVDARLFGWKRVEAPPRQNKL